MVGAGTILVNRYEILEKVGSGGMADVYKAKDSALNRFVAIKILKQEYSTDATFVKKFKVEAQSAAGLSHPNIVGVYDVGEENGTHFIVMELVQGITLKNYIDMKGKLAIREALNISVQIASGLSAAHANRVIHRDIKPQNIIMSRDGKVKVTDFGIAKMADSTTVTTTAAGTVHYISPEQARGGYSDEKSDIYSLGITMYEMVTGRVPFEGETNVAVALLHIQGEMTPPKELEPSIPESFNKIILKCTQKRPERRYASSKELISDLRKVLTRPDGDYVDLPGILPVGKTIVMDEDDIHTIKEAAVTSRTKKIDPEMIEKELAASQPVQKAPQVINAEEDLDEEEEEEDEESNSTLSKVMMGLGIAGFLILLAVIAVLVLNILGVIGGHKKKPVETEVPVVTEQTETEEATEDHQLVDVPEILGMTETQAKNVLSGRGFLVEVVEGSSEEYEEGEVYDQIPAAREQAEKGSTVMIYVNANKPTVELVDVSDMDYTQAKAKLESLGYVVSLEFENHDTIYKDHVIRTQPEAGSQVAKNDQITLYISSGKAIKEVEVPSLLGYTLDEATNLIASANLTYNGKYYDYSDDYPEGQVMNQSVSAGSSVEEGTSITLTISLGKKVETPPQENPQTPEEPDHHEEESHTATVFVPSPFGVDINTGSENKVFTEGTVSVVVKQDDGTTTNAYSAYHTDDNMPSSISVTSPSSSSGTAEIYIDGILFDTVGVSFN